MLQTISIIPNTTISFLLRSIYPIHPLVPRTYGVLFFLTLPTPQHGLTATRPQSDSHSVSSLFFSRKPSSVIQNNILILIMPLFNKRSITGPLDSLLNRPRPSAWQQLWKRPCIYLARKIYTSSWLPTIPVQLFACRTINVKSVSQMVMSSFTRGT